MSMYHGMDLSAFKKVSSDKKSTTLRHAKGHEIKIAHSALTPKLKGMLDGLQMFADNEDTVQPDPDNATPVSESYGAPQGAMPEAMDDSSPAKASDTPAAAPEPPPEGNRVMQNVPPPTDAQSPTANMLQPHDQVVITSPTKAGLDDESVKQKADFTQGQISHPTNFNDLYASKNTQGKIGMIVGMMLSGAGSGLTHQPNQYMDLIKGELDKDYNAQVQSAHNAQNWASLAQQKELNQSTMALNDAQKKSIGAATAKNAMLYNWLGQSRAAARRLGPQAMMTVDGTIEPYIDNQANINNAQAIRGARAGQDKPNYDRGVDPLAVEDAAMSAALGEPGAANPDQLRKEQSLIQDNRQTYDMYTDAFHKLDTTTASQVGAYIGVGGQAVAGALQAVAPLMKANPAMTLLQAASRIGGENGKILAAIDGYRNTIVEPIMSRITPQASGSVSTEEKERMTEAKLPSGFDWLAGLQSGGQDKVRAEKMFQGGKFFEDRERMLAPSLSHIPGAIEPFKLEKYSAPKAPAAAAEAKAAPQSGGPTPNPFVPDLGSAANKFGEVMTTPLWGKGSK